METKGVNQSGLDKLSQLRPDHVNRQGPKDAKASEVSERSSKDYGVSVSERARSMAEARARATQIARSSPDVREDRVAELKRQIQAGTYKADSGKIADGMLAESIRDQLSIQMHEEAKRR